MVRSSGYSVCVGVALSLALAVPGLGQGEDTTTIMPGGGEDKLSAGEDAGMAIGSGYPFSPLCILLVPQLNGVWPVTCGLICCAALPGA